MKKLFALLTLTLTFALGSSCFNGPSNLADYYTGNGVVLANDGYTPASGLYIDYYTLQVDFYDGTGILFDFPSLYTDTYGEFSFSTGNLHFASDWSSSSCSSYCTWYDDYGYCLEYVTDCYQSSSWLNVSDVTNTYSSITYEVDYGYGYGYITTPGYSFDSYYPETFTSTEIIRSDYFITPFDADLYSYYSTASMALTSSDTGEQEENNYKYSYEKRKGIQIDNKSSASLTDLVKIIPTPKKVGSLDFDGNLVLEDAFKNISSEKISKIKSTISKTKLHLLDLNLDKSKTDTELFKKPNSSNLNLKK